MDAATPLNVRPRRACTDATMANLAKCTGVRKRTVELVKSDDQASPNDKKVKFAEDLDPQDGQDKQADPEEQKADLQDGQDKQADQEEQKADPEEQKADPQDGQDKQADQEEQKADPQDGQDKKADQEEQKADPQDGQDKQVESEELKVDLQVNPGDENTEDEPDL